MDPCSSLPIYEDPPVVPPTTLNQQNYIAVWKGRDNTLLHGGIYDTLVHGRLDGQARREAKQLFISELPNKPEGQKPPSVFDNSSTSSEELFTIPTISTDGYQEFEWKVTNRINLLKSCDILSEKDDIYISTRIGDQLRSLEAVVKIGRPKNITLTTKSALDYVKEYKQLKTRFSHGDISQKSDVSVFMPYARLPNPCDVVPGWQLDFDALNNLIPPLRHRIPSVVPYYERVHQCYKKMEGIGKRLGQDYNKALDALLQSHMTKIDLDDALAQPATSQHEIAHLQKIYSEAQATYQDWIREALQFETFISSENGRAFVKLTDDFVKLVLPLAISVANGGLDDQSVECSIAAQDQAFRDRKKQQEKALKHAPGEQKCQKLINLDHSSSGQFNGNNYEYRDAVRAPDHSKCRPWSNPVAPAQNTCNASSPLDVFKHVDCPVPLEELLTAYAPLVYKAWPVAAWVV